MPTNSDKSRSGLLSPEAIEHMRDAMKHTLLRDQAVRRLEKACGIDFDDCDAIATSVHAFDSAEEIESAEQTLIAEFLRGLIKEN